MMNHSWDDGDDYELHLSDVCLCLCLYLQLCSGFVPVLNLGTLVDEFQDDFVFDLDVLSDIYAGKVTLWNDSRILETLHAAGSNKTAAVLPADPIRVSRGPIGPSIEGTMNKLNQRVHRRRLVCSFTRLS